MLTVPLPYLRSLRLTNCSLTSLPETFSTHFAHLSLPWSIGWVALSFLLFVRLSRYGDIRPNLTSRCPTPPNPYIFWKLMIIAIQKWIRNTNTKTKTNTKTMTNTKTSREQLNHYSVCYIFGILTPHAIQVWWWIPPLFEKKKFQKKKIPKKIFKKNFKKLLKTFSNFKKKISNKFQTLKKFFEKNLKLFQNFEKNLYFSKLFKLFNIIQYNP